MIYKKSWGKIYLFALIFFIIPCLSLFARDITIMVQDGDLEIPLEGATVLLWDGTESFCDENGKVVLDVPDDVQIVVRISYPGYENGRLLITPGENSFTVNLSLGGIMENQELVIEASTPETNEIESGRSITMSGKELTKTAEIGLIEDVMTSIKLLPGVGYAGFFNALPSIRGGSPYDLRASYDGFYVEDPFHWGGGFSIFDPKMVESAKLSHGVFSTRYGGTTSALLDITSRKPSPTEVELELGISSSATNVNFSIPFNGKGGIMFLGKVTYWDPFFWAAKQLLSETIPEVNSIKTAPYIRSGAVSANYRFTPNLEWYANGFFGSDGVGVFFETEANEDRMKSDSDMSFYWDNLQGFLTTGLVINPKSSMVLKTSIGAGFVKSSLESEMNDDVSVRYSDGFLDRWDMLDGINDDMISGKTDYHITMKDALFQERINSNYQGRVDFDWDLGKGFLFAAGVQEQFSLWDQNIKAKMRQEEFINSANPAAGLQSFLIDYEMDVLNKAINSSAYTLLEYNNDEIDIGAELGLRVDHIYFIGKDFSIQTLPAFNPRLNMDFGLISNKGIINDLTLTVGSGLFSMMASDIKFIEGRNGIDDFEMKPDRSWTSVIGTKIDFDNGFSFNIEAYYKYLFNRAYTTSNITSNNIDPMIQYFDGIGHSVGFDLILQKYESRYWDGWISYSFNYARYKDPNALKEESPFQISDVITNDWYYPSFHRFHNVNLFLNFKPTRNFNISTRIGFASGAPKRKAGEIISYPVTMEDGTVIEKHRRDESYSDTERTTFSIPMDIKFSFYTFDKKGKVQSEIYLGIENLLSFVYTAQGNTTFNEYTGKEDKGNKSAGFEMPIPMPSFGFKWSY